MSAEPSGSGGSEHVRWVQDCLNQVMQAGLPVDGILSPATRSVVRSFQPRENLRATGSVGPDTDEALKRACAGGAPADDAAAGGAPAGDAAGGDAPAADAAPADAPPAGGDAPADQEWGFESEFETESEDFLGDLFGRAKDWVADTVGGSRIIDLTDKPTRLARVKSVSPPCLRWLAGRLSPVRSNTR